MLKIKNGKWRWSAKGTREDEGSSRRGFQNTAGVTENVWYLAGCLNGLQLVFLHVLHFCLMARGGFPAFGGLMLLLRWFPTRQRYRVRQSEVTLIGGNNTYTISHDGYIRDWKHYCLRRNLSRGCALVYSLQKNCVQYFRGTTSSVLSQHGGDFKTFFFFKMGYRFWRTF